MKLLIVGCGYVGSEVVRQQLHAGRYSTIYAMTRSSERIEELESIGCKPLVGDWLRPASWESALPDVDHVLVAVPHRVDPELGIQTHVVGLQNLHNALPEGWGKLVYLSSTGVYGRATGTVDEATPVSPTREGPEMAVAAEDWLASKLTTTCCTIVRLAGIYGPERLPLAKKLVAGEPLQVPQEGHLNLVHVVDIARVIQAVFEKPLQNLRYVFSDGQPTLRRTFYNHLANLCGVAEPRYVAPDPSQPKARRATDKQINPAALVGELDFEFRFPSYREGLAQAIQS